MEAAHTDSSLTMRIARLVFPQLRFGKSTDELGSAGVIIEPW